MRTQLTQSTLEFLDRSVDELDKRQLLDWKHRHHFHYPWADLSVAEARELILEFEKMAAKGEQCEQIQPEVADGISPQFPVYSEIVEIAPIYREAVSLEVHKPVVSAAQIPGLLYLLRIPGHREGLYKENHGFGYHFHYGKLKSEVLIRTNLLLTFNPEIPTLQKKKKAVQDNQPPLYFEYHAEGKTKPIDAESIGNNKRHPIYLVCRDVGQKLGLVNFKRPAKDSSVFFGGQSHAV